MLDLITMIIIVLFAIRGWMKGIVMAFFGVIAILIGMLCCLRLSGSWAAWLLGKGITLQGWALPLSYILLFLTVVVLVRAVGKAVDSSLKFFRMGWMNKLSGALVYGCMAAVMWSSLLWIGNEMGFITPEVSAASRTYPWMIELAPWVASQTGKLLPFTKDLFPALERYFDQVNQLLQAYVDTSG